MKKFLALILSLALCFSIGSMAGCSDGNYEPVSAQELNQIAEMMVESEIDDPTSIGVEGGYKMTMQMGGSFGGQNMSMNINVEVVKVGDGYELATLVDTGTTVVKAYYKDGYLYGLSNYAGYTYKSKQQYTLDQALLEMPDVSEGLLELDDVIEDMSIYGDSFKCYIDRTGENIKIKIRVDYEAQGVSVDATIIYELNANYKLVAYEADMNTMGLIVKANLSAFAGPINFPSDLDTYGN